TGKYNVVKGENGEPLLKNALGSAAIFDRNKDPKTLSYTSLVSLEVFRRVAKGEDIPEAAHNQFHESDRPAPPNAYEAGHRDLSRPQGPPARPSPTVAPAPAKTAEPEHIDARADEPKESSWWVPLSAALLVSGLAALAWSVLRSKKGDD
ncbi:MAG: hypothetical protein HY075_13710, partial [Deltaproteobacteria bacterium]|nr:hypothetical protein [Deltaproteobacteria bacterium]